MKALIGVLVWIVGVAIALYLGLWVMLVGGIVQIVEAFKATPVEALGIAIGLVRMLGASLVGWGTFWITTVVSAFIVQN